MTTRLPKLRRRWDSLLEEVMETREPLVTQFKSDSETLRSERVLDGMIANVIGVRCCVIPLFLSCCRAVLQETSIKDKRDL